jgi:hypothetical protein
MGYTLPRAKQSEFVEDFGKQAQAPSNLMTRETCDGGEEVGIKSICIISMKVSERDSRGIANHQLDHVLRKHSQEMLEEKCMRSTTKMKTVELRNITIFIKYKANSRGNLKTNGKKNANCFSLSHHSKQRRERQKKTKPRRRNLQH